MMGKNACAIIIYLYFIHLENGMFLSTPVIFTGF